MQEADIAMSRHSRASEFLILLSQGGKIGITLNSDWSEPLTNSSDDIDAAERHIEFNLAWFADPVFTGACLSVCYACVLCAGAVVVPEIVMCLVSIYHKLGGSFFFSH